MVLHDGGINGFNSFAMRLPGENVYVSVLRNAESGIAPASEAAYKAAAIAIGRSFPVGKSNSRPSCSMPIPVSIASKASELTA
jgi:hypothetical protein